MKTPDDDEPFQWEDPLNTMGGLVNGLIVVAVVGLVGLFIWWIVAHGV